MDVADVVVGLMTAGTGRMKRMLMEMKFRTRWCMAINGGWRGGFARGGGRNVVAGRPVSNANPCGVMGSNGEELDEKEENTVKETDPTLFSVTPKVLVPLGAGERPPTGPFWHEQPQLGRTMGRPS